MKLLEPTMIGEMQLKNRIIMPAMSTRLANEIGGVTDATKDYYEQRARGGAGLVTVEIAQVVPPVDRYGLTMLRIDEERYLAGMSDLAELIKSFDVKASLQIYHSGRQAHGYPLVSASDVPHPSSRVVPKPLTIEEIGQMVQVFADCARRTQLAGFDAVEIHGGHGYLINQFMSPFTNKRTDKYGGSTENRARFALEIVQAVRQKVGPKFPILFKMSADEYIKGGLTLDESKVMAQMLEKQGVDALVVSGGIAESFSWVVQPSRHPVGCLVHLAQGVKQVVKIPVVAIGSIPDPMFAEQVLQDNKADLIAMGRALVADPDLPNKVMQGRLEDIRPCIRCNRCVERVLNHRRIRCTVNAAAGRESKHILKPAQKIKRVLVIGGGPAGMEAARVLALRGHKVSLFEKQDKLGGQLVVAARPPHKEHLPQFQKYLEVQIRKLGVDIKTGKEATAESVAKFKPEAIIMATGSSPCRAKFTVAPGANVAQAQDVLMGAARASGKVVIVGGGLVGAETAEVLANEGKEVTIVEMLPDIAGDVEMVTKGLLLARLQEKSVKVLTNAKVKGVAANSAVIIEKDGAQQEIPADTVVLAIGRDSNSDLLGKLTGKIPELYTVGDCVRPRKILDAVYEASRTALEI